MAELNCSPAVRRALDIQQRRFVAAHGDASAIYGTETVEACIENQAIRCEIPVADISLLLGGQMLGVKTMVQDAGGVMGLEEIVSSVFLSALELGQIIDQELAKDPVTA